MPRFNRPRYSPGCYTMPSGRSASRREYEARMRLLEKRASCPDCDAAATRAVVECDDRPGAAVCSRHQSFGR